MCKGSTAKGHPRRFVTPDLVQDGVLKPIGNGLFEFTRDWVFSSPSRAACTVLGYSVNGWDRWRDDHGRALREVSQRWGQ
ncbi:MAG: DUF4357 domain-containing protein [Planctomycetes bacterium]|nr:DUF4357 domain-containing protein [Planctomycetota bacterium]